MARNLVKAGHSVFVYDISEEAMKNVGGATPTSSVAELSSQCGTVITMLPGNKHVQEVYCGSDGILSTIESGALLIDSSTIDPRVTREVAEEAFKQKQATMVDAPVSGGVGGAEAGTLTFMVGGSDEAFERSKSVLSIMGKNIVHCGGVGTGEVAKLCNNHVLGISMIAVCEAMNMGDKLGMDPKLLAGILNTSTARCWSSDTYNPYPGVMEGVPASRDYAGGFGAALMLKDLGLAQDAAGEQPVPMGEMAHRLYSAMDNAGLGGIDFGGMLKMLQEHPDLIKKA